MEIKTIEEFARFIATQKWTFAKSMPKIPHEYIVRGQGNTPEEFEQAVRLIRETGYWHQWKQLRNLYLDSGDWFYWTMGAPVEKTTIINRAKFIDYPNRKTDA